MARMKTVGLAVGGVVGVGVIALVGGALYLKSASAARLAQTFDAHAIELPIPFPLTEAELDALRAEHSPPPVEGAADAEPDAAPADPLAGLDLDAIALERAVARGEHLVKARYACVACHGDDFGGGTMIDDPMIGQLLGPNLTAGAGGRVASYTAADWDRIVRHGLLPDGRPAAMPSEDFFGMSDRELSDIIAYIRTMPPVDATIAPPSLGPLGTALMATGAMPLSAERLPDHHAAHLAEPPPAEDSVAFGAHVIQVCTGCHRTDLSGGPMPFGPPDWPAAANLTPGPEGLAGWTFEDFRRTLTEGVAKSGAPVQVPMSDMTRFGQAMTETELRAMWTYLQSIPALPTGT